MWIPDQVGNDTGNNMPKTRAQKEQIYQDISDKLAKSKSVVFAADTGLDVKTVEKMRREMKQSGAEYMVAKKTLLKKAIKDMENSEGVDQIHGSVGMVFSYDDEIVGPRIANQYAKGNEKFVMQGGILEGKFILADMVKKLANIPGREQLLSKLVGTLNAPLSGLVGVLSGTTRKFVGTLSAIKDKKATN